MKTLLVLAQHPELAETVRAGLNPEEYRVLHRASPEEGEPLLASGVADACIIDVELTSVQGVWLLDKLRRYAPKCPLLIYTGAKQWEWEEEAYLRGVAYVLSKPVRGRMLAAVLNRLWLTSTGGSGANHNGGCKFGAGAQRAAELFGHSDSLAECRGDAEAIPAFAAEDPGDQSRCDIFAPARAVLRGDGAAAALGMRDGIAVRAVGAL